MRVRTAGAEKAVNRPASGRRGLQVADLGPRSCRRQAASPAEDGGLQVVPPNMGTAVPCRAAARRRAAAFDKRRPCIGFARCRGQAVNNKAGSIFSGSPIPTRRPGGWCGTRRWTRGRACGRLDKDGRECRLTDVPFVVQWLPMSIGDLRLNVVFFRTESGTEPVRRWLKSLPASHKTARFRLKQYQEAGS